MWECRNSSSAQAANRHSRLRADRYTERSFVPAFQAFCATVRAKALWKSPANVAEQKICATISACAGMTIYLALATSSEVDPAAAALHYVAT